MARFAARGHAWGIREINGRLQHRRGSGRAFWLSGFDPEGERWQRQFFILEFDHRATGWPAKICSGIFRLISIPSEYLSIAVIRIEMSLKMPEHIFAGQPVARWSNSKMKN